MRFMFVFALTLLCFLFGCGGEDDSSSEAVADETVVVPEETASVATVTVSPGWDVHRDILWVDCSPSGSDNWGESYQPENEGDTIAFQVNPGEYYDLRCLDSDLVHYYKWNVFMEEEGFVWDVMESDPDNLFRNFSHQCDSHKQISLVTLRNSHGCGVISSLVTIHSGYSGDVTVEHLNNQFIQPNGEITIRVRAGLSYTIYCDNTYGERILILLSSTIGDGGVVFEIEGN